VKLSLLFSLIVLVTLGAMSAAAQTSDTIQVSVPFAFTVHNVDMPAGIYRFTRASDGCGLLAVRNIDTRQETFFLSIATGFGTAPYQSSVAFRAGDGGYSLSDVRWAGYASGIQMHSAREVIITAGAQHEVTVTN
jgi:hypothetical protein